MSRDALYFGKAGQMAVASEFLLRGWNVAVPEVDIGEDAFVIRDRDFEAARVQVKAGRLRAYKKGSRSWTQFLIPLAQLQAPAHPELTYVLAARSDTRWESYLVIARSQLDELRVNQNLGSPIGPKGKPHGALMLRIVYAGTKVSCGSVDLTAYRNDWSQWPIVKH